MSNIKGLRTIILGVLCLGLIFIVNYGQAMVEENKDAADKSQPSRMENLDSQSKSPEYAPDQIIIKLKEGSTPDDIKDLNAKYNVTSTEKVFQESASPQDVLQQLKDKLEKLSTTHDSWYWQMDKNSKEYKDYMAKIEEEKAALGNQIKAQEELIIRLEQRQKRAPEGTQTPDISNIYLLKTGQNANVQEMAKEYSSNPNVEYAEPDYIVRVQMVPNDPYYSSSNSWGQDDDDLWGLKKIQAAQAWDMTQGLGIIVAVVDTGIDYNHEDIASNVWINTGEIPNNGIDDDHNGYIDDVRGWDFANNDNDPVDGYGHGTHCAGTIAAIGNNNKGIIGVAPKAKVMAVKGLDDTGSGDNSNLVQCLRYAADRGADIISNSWGVQGTSQVLTDAVNYAYSKGCVVVAAAGNSCIDAADFSPANIINVITVAALYPNDVRCDFSNYGAKIDVAAPGYNILSLLSLKHSSDYNSYIVGSSYLRLAGTSMACPHVAGVAALILAKTPAFNADQVCYVLRNSADDVDEIGWDIASGYGRVNAYKALQITNASKAVAAITSPVSGSTIKDKINIEGIATGVSYKLEYATAMTSPYVYATSPYVYTLIGSGSRVENGVLAVWDTTTVVKDGDYFLKLTVTDANNLTIENIIKLHLDNKNVYISSPFFDYSILKPGGIVSFVGNVKGSTFVSYVLEYQDTSSSWKPIIQKNQPVQNGVLAEWNTSFITTLSVYSIRLTANYSNEQMQIFRQIYFDPTLHSGWPQISSDKYGSFPAVVTDLDKDGNKEIIISSGNPWPHISIFRNDGVLIRDIVLPSMTDKKLFLSGGISTGDVDNDGFDEIVVSAIPEWTSDKYVFVYNHDGTLVSGWPVRLSPHPIFSTFRIVLYKDEFIVLSDVNRDGNMELIVSDGLGKISILGNHGNIISELLMNPEIVYTTGSFSVQPVVGNFDDDEDLEIAVGVGGITGQKDGKKTLKSEIHVFNYDGSEVNGWPKELLTIDQICSALVVGDINNDGKAEIIVPCKDVPNIFGGESDAAGIYVFDRYGNTLPGWPVLVSEKFNKSAALTDFNNDGYLEIMIKSKNSDLYMLDYKGQVISGWPRKIKNTTNDLSPIVIDITGDNKEDAIVFDDLDANFAGSFYARGIRAYSYNGSNVTNFQKLTNFGLGVGYGLEGVTFDDIDNDGKIEVVASSSYGDSGTIIYVWDTDILYNKKYTTWPTFQHDNQRTGIIDTIPPTGTITINSNAPYTNYGSVTLKLTATDTGGSGVAQMKFSTNNSSWSSPEAYVSCKSYYLSSSDGVKTVYVKFKDAAGNWSNAVSDTITMDVTPPTGTIKINNDAAYTGLTTVFLNLSAADTGSGMGGDAMMKFSTDNYTWSTPVAYRVYRPCGLPSGDGVKTVYVKFKDAVGNWSNAVSDTIILSTVPIITHTPITSAQKYKNIIVTAEVNKASDSGYGIERVTLFCRRWINKVLTGGEWSDLVLVTMFQSSNSTTYNITCNATLPGSWTEDRKVKYYINASDKAGHYTNTPEYVITRY